MRVSRRTALQAVAVMGLAAGGPRAIAQASPQASPQAYPAKPIRLVVPYPAGGGTDIMARILATQLAQNWGQPVLVDNKPGASGMLGNDIVAKAAPDGYTVLVSITAMIQSPALYAKVPYDVLRDFAPVSQLATSSDLFIVPASSPARSLAEFIALAKARPGKLNYGTYGNGTSSHMHGELLKMAAGINLISAPL